jgi:hypothetical protein
MSIHPFGTNIKARKASLLTSKIRPKRLNVKELLRCGKRFYGVDIMTVIKGEQGRKEAREQVEKGEDICNLEIIECHCERSEAI